ncbi:MAG: ABC transporter permease [Lachnospiraceae bacterium]|nr:ABC transporter permease [Lachnospiraceae bacterium]
MFFNLFKVQLKIGFRSFSNIFWTLMFPIILSTLFYVAFGNIYNEFSADPIKTAVVFETDNETVKENIKGFLESLTMNDHAMLEITYTDYDSAKKLLDDGEKVNGIIRVQDNGLMTLDISSNGVLSTIQESVITAYNQSAKLVEKVGREHPEKLPELLASLSENTSYVAGKNMAGDNKDPYITYFYNLLAMTALFASLNSVRIGNNTQANMSPLGARANASPARRAILQLSSFLASFIVQTLIVEVGLLYMLFVLKINFGGDIPMIFLTTIFATLLGTSLGFFIGNIGSFGIDKKESILVWISLLACALSGLMYGDLKVIITEKAPIINKINPAAVISDSYYCLNMFGTGSSFFEKILFMIILSAVFISLGMFLGRRNSYDSI